MSKCNSQHSRLSECALLYEHSTYCTNITQNNTSVSSTTCLFVFALTFKNLKLGKYAILISFNTMSFKRPCTKPGPVWRYSPCICLLIIGRHDGRHATKSERMLRNAQKAYLCNAAPRHRLPISRQPRPSSGSISKQYPTHCLQQITTVIKHCKHSAFCSL